MSDKDTKTEPSNQMEEKEEKSIDKADEVDPEKETSKPNEENMDADENEPNGTTEDSIEGDKEKQAKDDDSKKSDKDSKKSDEVIGEILHVTGFSPAIKVFDLKKLFQRFGKVGSVRILRPQKGRCYAFVNLKTGSYQRCIQNLDNTVFKGNIITVALSKTSRSYKPPVKVYTLYVTGLPRFYKVSQFRKLFSEYGDVQAVKTLKSPIKPSSYYTLVTIESSNIKKCIKELDKKEVEGKPISVTLYKDSEGDPPRNVPISPFVTPEPFIRPFDQPQPEPFISTIERPEPFARTDPFQQTDITTLAARTELENQIFQQRKAELEMKMEYQRIQHERERLNLEKELLLRERMQKEEMEKEALRIEQLREKMRQEKEELERLRRSESLSGSMDYRSNSLSQRSFDTVGDRFSFDKPLLSRSSFDQPLTRSNNFDRSLNQGGYETMLKGARNDRSYFGSSPLGGVSKASSSMTGRPRPQQSSLPYTRRH